MDKKIKGFRSRNGLLALTGVALATALVAPLAGSAALDGGGFNVTATNEDDPTITATRGMDNVAGGGGGGETPEEPQPQKAEGESIENPYGVTSFVSDGTITQYGKIVSRSIDLIGNGSTVAELEEAVGRTGVAPTVTSDPGGGQTKVWNFTDRRLADGEVPPLSPSSSEVLGIRAGLWDNQGNKIVAADFASMAVTIRYAADGSVPVTIVSIRSLWWDPTAADQSSLKTRVDAALANRNLMVEVGGKTYYWSATKGVNFPSSP